VTVHEQRQWQGFSRAGGLEAAVAAMVGMAQLRDPYTAGHEERVAVLAAAVARSLRLSEAEIQAIYLASLVHDVGKSAVPIEILSKPGPLTAREFELVKAHAEAGYRLITRIDAAAPFAQIVLQHHERLDGSGYPQRLRGEAISIGARILAVADVAEAMTAPRPHRPSLGLDAAIGELEVNKGRLYDIGAAESCIALLRGDHRPASARH
jgi:HD-GYP domain-containing protein (c-di-GMP phosphodiesterase class II)